MNRLFIIVFAMALVMHQVHAAMFRPSYTKDTFQWGSNPHASDPCTQPNCYNHVKEGYNLTHTPIIIKNRNVDIEFQGQDRRPSPAAGVLSLTIETQPGCVVSGIATTKVLGLFPRDEVVKREVAPTSDSDTVLMHFGGMFYEHLPAGVLSVRFETRNDLTNQDTCVYRILHGTKNWV